MKNKSKLNLSLRKVILSALVAAPLATSPVQLRALPVTTGSNVTSNSAATTFSTIGTTLLITDTSTNRLVLKWGEFGSGGSPINAGDTVRWNLGSASSAVLNMVSTGATLVNGTLSSNGQILILNPNGITLGATAVVNASGLTLSTIPEAEFQFLSSGTLGLFGTTTTTQDVTVTMGAAVSVGSSGSVFLAGRQVAVAGTVDASSLGVQAVNNTVTLGSGGALTVGLASGATGFFGTAVDSYGNLTVNSGGGAVNLAANAVTLNGNSATVTTGGGAVTAPSALRIGFGGGDDSATLTVNSGTGTVTVSNLAANNNRRVNVALTSSQANITAQGTSELRLNASTITYSGAGDAITLAGARAISSGGDTSFGGTNRNISLTSTGGANLASLAFSGNGDLVFTTLSQAGATNSNVTLTSKTGSVSIPAITLSGSGGITVTAATNIVQTAAIASPSATGTFEAVSGSVTLTSANDLATVVLKNSPGGATYVDASALTVGNNTNLVGVGNVTAGGALTFAGNVRFQNNLAATGVGIADTTNNLVIDGALTLNAGTGAVILDGSLGNGVGLGNRYGQINVVQADGGVRIYETTTVNLGNITTAGTLRAWSSAGDVVNNGAISATQGVQVGAGTAVAPGNITLSNTSNNFGTGLVILDDFTVLANTSSFGAPGTGGDPIGTLLARDLTISSNVGFTLGTLAATNNTGIAGNLSITAASGGITLSGATVVAGTVTLSAPGAITGTNAANAFGTVTVTSQDVVSILSTSALTVNATLTGTGNAGFTASGAALRIGSFTSERSTGTVTFTTTNNSSITDTVNGIRIFGAVNFASTGSVTVNRAGHSFGLVGVTTGNNQSATVVESGTLRLGTVLLTNTGSFTATSTTGDIIQDTTAGGIRFGNNSSTASMTATMNAPVGNVVLDDAADNRIPRLVATAAGNVTLNNTRATALGNITAGGELTVNAAGNAISQVSGTRLNVFSTVSLTNTGANDITLGNTGNRLGGVVASSGSGNITITESTTLNLKSVNTTGTLAATSETGNVIDSTDSAIANNNIGGAAVLGAATFSAPNGNIALGLSGSNYNTVGFTTGGNVSILDSTGNLTLSSSNIGGALSVTTTTGGASLNQSGALTVAGNVVLTTNAGNIDLSNGANQFGALRFIANTANIAESTTLNLAGGTVASGAVQLSTSSNFITSGSGSSTFSNNLTISAGGTIVPGANSMFVIGTFTVFSNATKDLSALSYVSNLFSHHPVYLGSGTNIKPPDEP